MNIPCPLQRRWQRKKEARPAEILQAALALFAEKGFSATRMEEIARRAGVTKGTPYLYFANKEELFKAMLRETLVSNLSDMQKLVDAHDGPIAPLLYTLVAHWWNQVGAQPSGALCKLMIGEAANFPELTHVYQNEVLLPGRAMVTRLVQAGIARGEFAAVDPEETADMLMAPAILLMIEQHSFGQFDPQGKLSPRDPVRYLHHALDIMLGGLLKQPHPDSTGQEHHHA